MKIKKYLPYIITALAISPIIFVLANKLDNLTPTNKILIQIMNL